MHKRVQPLTNKGPSIVDKEEKEAGVQWWAEREEKEGEGAGVWWCTKSLQVLLAKEYKLKR